MERSVSSLIEAAGVESIGAAARREQAREEGVTEFELNARMREYLDVMRESISAGMDAHARSLSGMVGGDAAKLNALAEANLTASSSLIAKASARALAVAECNACMGKIVAAPTAGACGLLPAALMTLEEERGISSESLTEAMFTAAAIGGVIAERASISGAEGGCQAEIGSAAAMTAAAIAQLMGGTPQTCANASAFAIMSLLGLVCDPVKGLVEVPCVYRNATGVAVAFVSADMALAGIRCPIPVDEIIDAMRDVGAQLPSSLRETGEGGCAACPSVCV